MVDSTTLDNVGTEQSITPPPPIQPPLRDHTGPSFDFDALLGNLNHQAIAGGMPAQAPPRPDLTGSLEVMAVSQDDQGMQTVEVRLNLENIGDASADAPLKVQFYALSTQNSFLEPVELASLQSFDLAPRGAHVENLTIDSAAGPINAYGNALNNSLTGNDFNNTMWGREGDDQLWGRAGDDVLTGWTGNDHLYGEADNDTL